MPTTLPRKKQRRRKSSHHAAAKVLGRFLKKLSNSCPKRQKSRAPVGDSVILLDTSESTKDLIRSGFQNVHISRLQASIQATHCYVNYKRKHFPRDHIYCVAFATTARKMFGPVRPHQLDQMNALKQLTPAGGTNLYAGVHTSIGLLKRSNNLVKNVILITDGDVDHLQKTLVLTLAREARKCRIRIHTIGVGSQGGRYGFNPSFLNQIAQITRGTYRHCASLINLKQALKTLS